MYFIWNRYYGIFYDGIFILCTRIYYILTSSLIYNLWYEKRNKDYLIVLDAGLLGDKIKPLLAGRIDKAIEFYNSQKEKGNRSFEHVKQGVSELNDIFKSYDYDVLLLADRGFKSIDLFKYIDELGWKYCINGAPKIYEKLKANGVFISLKRTQRLMIKLGM